MGDIKKRVGSIILNGSPVDYLLQTDGQAYIDLQVRRGRYTTYEKSYDFSFILSDGGNGLTECDKKFPGLLRDLAKRYPELQILPATPVAKKDPKGPSDPEDKKPNPQIEKAKKEGFAQAYQPWTAEEDQRLTEGFKKGNTWESLAEIHGRKLGAIKSRLAKLGLIKGYH